MMGHRSLAEPSTPAYSMASRLVAMIALTAFGLVLAASFVLYWGTQQVLRSADDQVIEKRLNTVADLLKSKALNEGEVAHEVSEDNQGPRQIFIRVVSDIEALSLETPGMLRRLPVAAFPEASTAPPGEPQRTTIKTSSGDTYRAVSMHVPISANPPHQAIIQVATDTTLDRDGMAWLRWLLASVVAAALPFTAAASWLLVRQQLKPLDRIASAAQRVDSATIEQRLALDGLPRELYDLGSQFNAMLDRLERTWTELKHYADTIAHEMRTPINRLQLQSEIALRDADSVEALRAVVVNNIEECDRLTRMLNALLFLARADSKQAGMVLQPLILAVELQTIADYFDASASLSGKSIEVACDAGLKLMADRELFQRAVGNLISNAIAHTPESTRISIKAGYAPEVRDEIVVEVSDTGSGIGPQHHAKIFDRFYRIDDSKEEPASDNLGLGLSIVKSIIELHGGWVSLTNSPAGGASFELHFPAEGRSVEPSLAARTKRQPPA